MATNVNMLWAHLLRKDATSTSTDTPAQIPPIAPQDKTGTSMRMLIHDTAATLEKFSARLDGLVQRVEECRVQVVNASGVLDGERDRVLAEVLAIANRCQAAMKAHVGAPAQAHTLDLVQASQVSTEKSVQALEKRIDALQALLQTQAHAMQSIQDQQNTLIGAILPLVPVLHGVPTQIDQTKTALADMVTNVVSTMTSSLRSTLVAELANAQAQARSSTRIGSLNRSMSSSRRMRSMLGPHVPPSSPLDSRGPHLRLKRTRVERATDMPRKLSRLADPGDARPRTPRRPLADLPLPSRHSMARQQEATTALDGLDVIKKEDIFVPKMTDVISIHSSPLSSPPVSPRPPSSPVQSMSLRDRRAQMSRIGRTETRRFIPLVPWSDGEE